MNRLATASSAYLRSAAHQPVHWFPWDDEAFETARRESRPILLDIGAVWCHWCHVMDGESYEDPALAEFLNRHFVCIKVDRDERPDVDARYQRAVQAFSGQGGWPLTAFLTPDGDAFYGGTYFPPEGKYERPGFLTVLRQVLRVYQDQQDQVSAQAGVVRRLVAESLDESGAGTPSSEILDTALEGMARVFDFAHGGFGTAPKFPHPAAIELMLTRWFDRPRPVLHQMAVSKLSAMASGGIHDHLGGGFHRYSTDARWVVPHFEKMAYDNSELLRAYLDGWSVFGEEVFAEVARGIVRWVREVLADPEGGYGASQDADVGLDDDGDYFTWTREEAALVLDPGELELVTAYYDIGTAGEMHHNPGKNVLFIAATLESIAAQLGRSPAELAQRLPAAVEKLREARSRRTPPFVDRTRYANWNAMMARAMLRAGVALPDDRARDHALRTLNRIWSENPSGDAVTHTPGGRGGLLEDQVQVAMAALEAYEVTTEPQWLDWARALMDRVWRDYWDPELGGLFDTVQEADAAGLLPVRGKPVQDSPTPSPNGVAGLVLSRLAELDPDPRWTERRDALVAAFAGAAVNLGVHGSTFLLALDWQIHPATHLVIVGPAADPEAARMHRRALATFLPRRVVQWVDPDSGPARLPEPVRAMLARGTAAYLCMGTSCRPPARTDQEWQARLADVMAETRARES